MYGSADTFEPFAIATVLCSGTWYIRSTVAPPSVGEVWRIMSEARRQNEWPTPPLATTASHSFVPTAGVAKPPGGMTFVVQALLMAAAGFGAVPVVSRRP